MKFPGEATHLSLIGAIRDKMKEITLQAELHEFPMKAYEIYSTRSILIHKV